MIHQRYFSDDPKFNRIVKNLLTIAIVIIVNSQLFIVNSQEVGGNKSFIKSIQGTWAFTESGADLWLKVVIKGKTLKAYAAYPNSGKFITKSTQKIQEVRIIYRKNNDRGLKSESFAQIRNSTLSNDRIYSGIADGKQYIIFGKKDSPKLIRVSSDFNPWE
jgi:hypothetical protein